MHVEQAYITRQTWRSTSVPGSITKASEVDAAMNLIPLPSRAMDGYSRSSCIQIKPCRLIVTSAKGADRGDTQVDPNPSENLFGLSSDEYDAYTKRVVAHVRKHFKLVSHSPLLECTVSTLVDSTGKIFNYRIFQGSSNEEFDEDVIVSLLAALPLAYPPAKLRENKWSKAPIALKFRSDGWIVPYVEPDPRQSSSGDEVFDNSVLSACMSAEPYPVRPTFR